MTFRAPPWRAGFFDDVVFHEPHLSEEALFLAFPKSRGPSSQARADAFDAALQRIREDGSYRVILARFGFR